MNLELVLGLLGGGGVLTLLGWWAWEWKKLTAKASRLENEVRVVTEAFSSQAKINAEERDRARRVEELLRSRLGQARTGLEELVQKVNAKQKGPALVDAVRDLMDGLMSGARAATNPNKGSRSVPNGQAAATSGTRKGR